MNSKRDGSSYEEAAGTSLQGSQQNFSLNNSDSNNHLMINYSIPVPGTSSDGTSSIIPASVYNSHSGNNINHLIPVPAGSSTNGYYTSSAAGNSLIIPPAPLYNSHSSYNNHVVMNSIPVPGISNGYDGEATGTSLQESQLPQPVVVIQNSTNTEASSSRDKAANFHALHIKVGRWERCAIRQDGITVKFYYKKKKLVWEILELNSLKNKIEIQWSNIRDIRRTTDLDGCEILEVELNKQPAFYKEKDPIPRMHATWESTSDFTGGEALVSRIHMLKFASGVLDKYYQRLLESLPELIRRRPFPTSDSPSFPIHRNSSGQQLDMRSLPAYFPQPPFKQPQALQGSMASHPLLPPPPPYNLQFPSQSQFSSVEESRRPITTIPPSLSNSIPTIPVSSQALDNKNIMFHIQALP